MRTTLSVPGSVGYPRMHSRQMERNDNGRQRRLKRGTALVLGIGVLALGLFLGRPVFHLAKTALFDRRADVTVPSGKANDASRLDETPIREAWTVPADRAKAESELARLLKRARETGTPVSMAGARHSMGGQSIARNGIVIDMLPLRHMTLDRSRMILRVEAGARWSEVLRFLNREGCSVEIMQSNDDFSVGGSLSVNCHGWQFDRPPISSTVESCRLMLASGEIV
ncbi:MAG TPA: FAD-dependent oxidoreductase, partial [Verrucomicrobiae bacterium]|nr:FAD-dependent oxidoreductase [Verrucomicrobiae bacterium]